MKVFIKWILFTFLHFNPDFPSLLQEKSESGKKGSFKKLSRKRERKLFESRKCGLDLL